MRLTDKIASLSPAIVCVGFLLLFIGGGVILNTFALGSSAWIAVYSAVMAILMVPLLAWHYSIYRAASDRSEAFVGHRGRRGFLFALCAGAMAIFLLTIPLQTAQQIYPLLSTVTGFAMFIASLSYFAAIWAAANALTRFDEQKKSVETHKTLGSFVLQLYFFIGIWFIYPRIKRMLATPAPEQIVQ